MKKSAFDFRSMTKDESEKSTVPEKGGKEKVEAERSKLTSR